MADTNDRIAALESQLSELQVVLDAERRRHKEEAQAQASKLRLLEARVKDADANETTSRGRTNTSTGRGDRTVVSTPRTSDNLFVAIPARHETRDETVASVRPAPRATPRTGGAPTSARGAAPVVKDRGTVKGAAANRAARSSVGGAANVQPRPASAASAASPERTSALSSTQRRATALQHAWDKFCVTARGEFNPKELALVSAETLHSLMDHYKIRSSVERAQIEGQWALLQEGKSTVGENATPKPSTSAKRPAVKRAEHPTPFDLQGSAGGPHLSARLPLTYEGIKSSNPNETTSGSRPVRSHSTTVLIRPREAGPSNPNDTQCTSVPPKLCFRRSASAGPAKETPRGMRHVQPTESGEYTPRGIKSNGSTRLGGDDARPVGVKCHIGPQHDDATPRRGVKTFDQVGSPTESRRYCRMVTTPPHLDRCHLLTETLGSRDWQPRRIVRDDPSSHRLPPYALGN